MTKRRLKPFVVPMLYTIAITFFVFSLYYLQKIVSNKVLMTNENQEETNYVDDEILNNHNYLPVINMSPTIIKPYISDDVTVSKNYYDYQGSEEEQQNSIIYYEETYMQNSGIDYTGPDPFEVVSILSGKVIEIKEDNILGTVIKVEHDQGLISVYESLSEVTVKIDEEVKQGQTLGQSGTSNLNPDLQNHLHFEILLNDLIMDPDNCYGKTIEDIIGE